MLMYDKWPRPLNERPRTRRPYRSRDKVTGQPNGKRWCPAYEGIISAQTCRDSRGKVKGCDARCPYYAPLLVTASPVSRAHYPMDKIYAGYIAQSGAGAVVVTRRNPDGSLMAMFLDLDFWKLGIRDCFVDARIPREALEKELKSIFPPLEEKPLTEMQSLVKWAEKISREVGHEIPWEFRHWGWMLEDMSKVPEPQGSLFKCAKCGNELPAKAVELMKQYALRPDVQFYMVCRKCGGEFEDDW